MSNQRALDVSQLPTFAFGHRSPMWWGVMGMIAIEGTMFAIMCATYIYLRWRVPQWPPGLSPPDLLWGTVQTVLLLVSLVPNQLTKWAAQKLDLERVRLWMLVCCAFGVILIAVRIMEFTALNAWWDTNAYGSAVWAMLGFHTVHVATDLADTMVLTVLMFTGPLEGRRFVDVTENSMYWYFIVASPLPLIDGG
jgi:heme/copper-type cytochrome/quinol oxidase subunit 3